MIDRKFLKDEVYVTRDVNAEMLVGAGAWRFSWRDGQKGPVQKVQGSRKPSSVHGWRCGLFEAKRGKRASHWFYVIERGGRLRAFLLTKGQSQEVRTQVRRLREMQEREPL